MHLQFKYWRCYMARSTLWYRIMQNGCLSFTETQMVAEEALVKVHAPAWIWACWCKPLPPHCVCASFRAVHKWQRASPLRLWDSHVLVTGWFGFSSWRLWKMAAGMCSGMRGTFTRRGELGDRWWAESSKERDLTAKKAPDTHVGAGEHCQALCKPSTEIALKGSFPLGKIRWRRRQHTIPPCSF